MSISDEDTDAGSDFIELQPISEYEESKENIYLGIDLTPNVDDGYPPSIDNSNSTFSTSDSVSSLSVSLSFFSSLFSSCAWKSSMFSLLFVSSSLVLFNGILLENYRLKGSVSSKDT
jgi:hypothetical protein